MALVGHISGSTQSNSVSGISGSVIVANRPQALFPAMPGTDVKFFVSGSSTATPSDVALFGGDLMSSGSFNLKSGTGGISQFSVNSTGLSISTAVGAQMITLASSNGLITTAGDIAVNGGDITTTSASATLFNSTATTVSIAAAGTSVSIGSAVGTGTTTVNNSLTGKGTNNNIDMLNVTGSAGLSVTRNVVISGDLTVNGAMTTVNTTNLEVKDSVIGLGFASGTIAQTAGDRGWIGGQAGTNNVMSKWDNTASEFAFATTTSSATGSFGIAAYSNLHAANIQGSIVSASLGFSGSHTRLIDGTSAFVAGTGITIASASNGAVTISTTGGSTVAGSDTQIQYNNGGAFGADADFTFTAASNLLSVPNITTAVISGSSGNLTIFGALGDNNTLNLGTNTATTVNVGGALTNVNVGPTSGDITLDGTGGGTVYVKAANLLPYADVSLNLGSPSRRWANIYTGDLHLRNDRGDYTLIEEEDFLTIRFNKSGKRYKFLLERVPELDEDPILNLK